MFQWLRARVHTPAENAKNAFPEIRGKIVEGIEMMHTENGYGIGIMFQDRTYLNFDVEPYITISADLSHWKTKNYKPLKRWPTVHSR